MSKKRNPSRVSKLQKNQKTAKELVKKNPIAKILRTPMFQSKMKLSGKIYNRKKNS